MADEVAAAAGIEAALDPELVLGASSKAVSHDTHFAAVLAFITMQAWHFFLSALPAIDQILGLFSNSEAAGAGVAGGFAVDWLSDLLGVFVAFSSLSGINCFWTFEAAGVVSSLGLRRL